MNKVLKPQPCNHGMPIEELCPYCDGTAEEQNAQCDQVWSGYYWPPYAKAD